MIPIVTCTVGSPSLKVFKCSVETYAPDTPLIVHEFARSTMGDCFNKAMDIAFQTYDEIFIANDDVVINPWTIPLLTEDVKNLKEGIGEDRLGLVGCIADNIRLSNNVRVNFMGDQDYLRGEGKWASEDRIKQVPVLAPIFAYISKKAFSIARFPETNWFTDDLMCYDLEAAGRMNFVSRSYVHHVGSASIGTGDVQADWERHDREGREWMHKHRPDFIPIMDERKYGLSKANI